MFIQKITDMFPNISLSIFGVYPYVYDNDQHLRFCQIEGHHHNIMNHIGPAAVKFYKPEFVPEKKIMIQLINMFNERMLSFCKTQSIGFHRIESISKNCMNHDQNDHHFNSNITELWEPILKEISSNTK